MNYLKAWVSFKNKGQKDNSNYTDFYNHLVQMGKVANAPYGGVGYLILIRFEEYFLHLM